MIIVEHLTGALAGKSQELDGKADRIAFGRGAEQSDVVFPPDARMVSRQHFALVRRPSGDWTFDIFGDSYVLVDGEPAEQGAKIRDGQTVKIGADDGPTFKVRIAEGVVDENKTLAQPVPLSARQAARGAASAASRARLIGLAAVAVAILAVAGGGFAYWTQRSGEQRVTEAMQKLREEQARIAADSIPREHRERLAQAAYLVLIRDKEGKERGQGTAFPIGPNLLGTNAHVAEIGDGLKEGETFHVKAPGEKGKSYRVVRWKLHPGYKALDAYMSRDPLLVESFRRERAWGLQRFDIAPGYDVALMWVEENDLSPILPVASRDEILKLRVGDPIAYAGYPMERIVGSEGVQFGPSPQVRTGVVTNLTDVFSLPGEPDQRRLVHHDLGITGGASGSAVIGPGGKLVALINAMNIMPSGEQGRQPNAALINYAQRADFLVDLIEDKADATLAADQAYWARQTANFKRGADIIVARVLEDERPKEGSFKPVEALKSPASLTEADRVTVRTGPSASGTVRRKQHTFRVKAGERHTFFGYAQQSSEIRLQVMIDGRQVAVSKNGVWYPHVTYKSDADATVDVYVMGGDKDISYTLSDFVWQGETKT